MNVWDDSGLQHFGRCQDGHDAMCEGNDMGILEAFPEMVTKSAATPASENLFNVNNSPALDKPEAESFHTFMAKNMFLTKQARPDIAVAAAFLCARVKESTEHDWAKLKRMMNCLKCARDDCLRLRADGTNVIKWSVDFSCTSLAL